MGLLHALSESPDEAWVDSSTGTDILTYEDDCLTFGVKGKQFWAALHSDCPGVISDLLFDSAPGKMTHQKLGIVASGNYQVASGLNKQFHDMRGRIKDWGPFVRYWKLASKEPTNDHKKVKKEMLEYLSISELETDLVYKSRNGLSPTAARQEQVDRDFDLIKDINDFFRMVNLVATNFDRDIEFAFSGRAWHHPKVGLLISIWTSVSSEVMGKVAKRIKAKLNLPDDTNTLYQDVNFEDDQWSPLEVQAVQLDDEVKKEIISLSAALHTADPVEKALIRAKIKELRNQKDEEPHPAGSTKSGERASKAGFDTAAEFNYNRRQESIKTKLTRALREAECGK